MRADVERAMRKVARDLFTPGIPLEEAYEDTAVITIRRGEEAISSVSAPYLIAEMLVGPRIARAISAPARIG
ncbi:MAG: hypothetical protein ACT4NY_03810 [Pseudonocardiales bacterium]